MCRKGRQRTGLFVIRSYHLIVRLLHDYHDDCVVGEAQRRVHADPSPMRTPQSSIVDEMLTATKNSRAELIDESCLTNVGLYHIDLPTDFRLRVPRTIFFVSSGAWHVAAWNYSFPTAVEARLWQGASVAALAGPFLLILGPHLSDLGMSRFEWFEKAGLWVPVSLFTLARAVIMVETIISLRPAPAGIYKQVEWSSYIAQF